MVTHIVMLGLTPWLDGLHFIYKPGLFCNHWLVYVGVSCKNLACDCQVDKYVVSLHGEECVQDHKEMIIFLEDFQSII